jgi:hypothetical protein
MFNGMPGLRPWPLLKPAPCGVGFIGVKSKNGTAMKITRKIMSMPEREYWMQKHDIIDKMRDRGFLYLSSIFFHNYVQMYFVRCPETD